MNKNRLEQILTVMLFPFCDPGLGSRDPLLEQYLAYEKFEQCSALDPGKRERRERAGKKYQRSRRELMEYLRTRSVRVKSCDDLQQLCELFYPRREFLKRKREADAFATAAGFYLKKASDIAGAMLTYRDGVAALRTWKTETGPDILSKTLLGNLSAFDKVEVWSLMIRFVVPDLFLVLFARSCGLGREAYYEQKPMISLADKLLVKCLQKGVAENHLHFNAGFDYVEVWISRMNPAGKWKDETAWGKEDIRYAQAAVFRCLAAGFLKDREEEKRRKKKPGKFKAWLDRRGDRAEAGLLRGLMKGEAEPVKGARDLLERIAVEWNPGGLQIEHDFLLETVYRDETELKASSELLLLDGCCACLKEEEDGLFSILFLQYLRTKNALFSESWQRFEIQGLLWFQGYFDRSKRMLREATDRESMMLEVFRSQAKIASLKKLEIRIGPNVDWRDMDSLQYDRCSREILSRLNDQLGEVFRTYRRYLIESGTGVAEARALLEEEEKRRGMPGFSWRDLCGRVRERIGGLRAPALGIVYHFIKTERLDDLSGYFCWRDFGQEGGYSGHSVVLRQDMANIAMAIEELRSSVLHLDEYIVGIDAASDENAMEPWMFAPAYNRMRSRRISRPVRRSGESGGKYSLVQNIGFTYHVGEDFRHILSGLRHIDEVIERFHYKPGDRLGHAIALGVDIRKWARGNEVIPVPAQEYLEDLLWIWGVNVKAGIDLPLQLERLEERILSLAAEIYARAETITVRMLYEAYSMKFLEDHETILREQEDWLQKEEQGTGGNGAEEEENGAEGGRTFCYYSHRCAIGNREWTAKRLLCTNYCPVFLERYQSVILTRIEEPDVAVWERLQEYLLEKVEKNGIYVETNPASNLTIGDFEDFRDHPIFRMNSIRAQERGHRIMVTVNSDDPAVFHTNVENELSYLYYATEHAGVPKEEVLSWIDRIRQNGLEASFIRREKDTAAMLDEISGILDDLHTN